MGRGSLHGATSKTGGRGDETIGCCIGRTSLVMGVASAGFADLTSTVALEEAFVDAVGICGPSSNVAGSLGKSDRSAGSGSRYATR